MYNVCKRDVWCLWLVPAWFWHEQMSVPVKCVQRKCKTKIYTCFTHILHLFSTYLTSLCKRDVRYVEKRCRMCAKEMYNVCQRDVSRLFLWNVCTGTVKTCVSVKYEIKMRNVCELSPDWVFYTHYAHDWDVRCKICANEICNAWEK